MQQVLYAIIGLLGGLFSGVFGIGGGVIMIPAMVFLFGLTQHQAQGTSLAILLPPVGVLAVLRYYHGGNVRIDIALLAALGFILGAFVGAHFIHSVPDVHLKRAFGILMVVLGLKMIIFK